MNSTAYALWDRIKKKVSMENSTEGVISLNGTISDVRAANEIANAGFIKIYYINKYELKYEINYTI